MCTGERQDLHIPHTHTRADTLNGLQDAKLKLGSERDGGDEAHLPPNLVTEVTSLCTFWEGTGLAVASGTWSNLYNK